MWGDILRQQLWDINFEVPEDSCIVWAEQLSQSLDSAFKLGRNQDSRGRQAGVELVDSGVRAELEIRDAALPTCPCKQPTLLGFGDSHEGKPRFSLGYLLIKSVSPPVKGYLSPKIRI